jgi:hypothetical protein
LRLAHRGIHAGGTILRHHHGQRAAGVGRAQAGAEIVRVLYAVQHQHQRINGRGHGREQFILMPRRKRFDLRHHALVIDLADASGQLPALDAFHPDAGLLGQLQQLAHAWIVAPRIHLQPPQSRRRAAQQGTHGMQAVDGRGRVHRCLL